MTQEELDILTENAAQVLVQYDNGMLDSLLQGTGEFRKIFNNAVYLHYLYGALKGITLTSGVPYIGSAVLSGSDVEQIYHKIWHYNGQYASVDLSNYTDITADDGGGGSSSSESSSSTSSDNVRAGHQASSVGTNIVTFTVDGIVSPLASADYVISAWNLTSTGYKQVNLNVTTQIAGGFVIDNVITAGTLYYVCTLET